MTRKDVPLQRKLKKLTLPEKNQNANNGEDFSRSPRSPRSPSTKEQLVTKAKAITKTKTKLTEPVYHIGFRED